MKILVVGGTRFFGIPMVNALLAAGHDVTIASRGNVLPEFDGEVKYVVLDRMNSESVKAVVGDKYYDVIIDKVAYGSLDVKALLENVSCDKYIQMSTCSVYDVEHEDIKEEEFKAEDFELKWEGRLPDYSETKRNAERAVLEFMDPEKVSFVRYPIVMGDNDYTGRLDFYITHIKEQKPMHVDDYDKSMAFIWQKNAGEFIAYLADHFVSGPVNGCSRGAVRIGDIIEYIEKKTGLKAVMAGGGDEAPYNGLTDTDSYNTDKAEATGYRFTPYEEWLYQLIDRRLEAL